MKKYLFIILFLTPLSYALFANVSAEETKGWVTLTTGMETIIDQPLNLTVDYYAQATYEAKKLNISLSGKNKGHKSTITLTFIVRSHEAELGNGYSLQGRGLNVFLARMNIFDVTGKRTLLKRIVTTKKMKYEEVYQATITFQDLERIHYALSLDRFYTFILTMENGTQLQLTTRNAQDIQELYNRLR